MRIEPEEATVPIPPPHCLGPFSVRGVNDSSLQSSKDKKKGAKVADASSAFSGRVGLFGQSKKAPINIGYSTDAKARGDAVSFGSVVSIVYSAVLGKYA